MTVEHEFFLQPKYCSFSAWIALAAAFLGCLGDSERSLAQVPSSLGVTEKGGRWTPPFKGALAGRWLLLRTGDNITLSGKGYFRVRIEIEYWRRKGIIKPICFDNVVGKMRHVASGGGRKLNDLYPHNDLYTYDRNRSLLGRSGMGYSTVENNTYIPWLNEFFWLDGVATLSLDETRPLALINYAVLPVSFGDIRTEIHKPLDPKRLWLSKSIRRFNKTVVSQGGRFCLTIQGLKRAE